MDDQNESNVVPVILIVDDNPQNLQVLGKQLKDKKYLIEFATNGISALDWLEKKPFDLVLLDINMPDLSGFDVCKRIRADKSFNNMPVIFLSAETERESILKGFELGAQDYITKPFDGRELLVRVKTHITLKKSLENLEKLNKSLEEKVQERTKQLKEANEELEATNLKLVGLDKAKSEFLNLISHEIRTPLNGIMMPLELLKDPLNASEIGGLVDILDTSVKRLERFSLDALLITRLKTRENDLKIETIQIQPIIKAVLAEFIDSIVKKNIQIAEHFGNRDLSVSGEADLIKKCIANILENAILVSPENGKVLIKTSSDINYSSIEFEDEGPGFAPEIARNMTELFALHDKSRDNSKGIGLPIVNMIMEAHSGRVMIGNKQNGGAFVRLQFKNIQN